MYGVQVTSDFEMGNGILRDVSGNVYTVEIEDDYRGYNSWYYLKLDVSNHGRYVFRIKTSTTLTHGRFGQMNHPLISRDDLLWNQIPRGSITATDDVIDVEGYSPSEPKGTWSSVAPGIVEFHPPPGSSVEDFEQVVSFPLTLQPGEYWIAQRVPLTYTRSVEICNSLAESDISDIVARRTFATSARGRRVDCFEVTAPGDQSGRREIVVAAQWHGSETSGGWAALGVLKFLARKDSSTANRIRNDYVVYVIPMMNPDGVAAGNSSLTADGTDLWRDVEGSDPITKAYLSLVRGKHAVLHLHGWGHQDGTEPPFDGLIYNTQGYDIARFIRDHVSGSGSQCFVQTTSPVDIMNLEARFGVRSLCVEINDAYFPLAGDMEDRGVSYFKAFCGVYS